MLSIKENRRWQMPHLGNTWTDLTGPLMYYRKNIPKNIQSTQGEKRRIRFSYRHSLGQRRKDNGRVTKKKKEKVIILRPKN